MDQLDFSRAAMRHSVALLSHALRFTGDEDVAKDLVQDTLVKGIRFCKKFDSGTNIKGWLYVIMRNTFINNYHKDQKKNLLIKRDEELSDHTLFKNPERNSAEGKFVMEDIQKVLDSIPPTFRIPFQRYFEGYKYEEISVEYGIPLGTVKTHIHQARLLLKKHLKQYRET